MQEEQASSKPYLIVTIFLIAILIVGAVVLIFGKKTEENKSLQNLVPSATIEESATPVATNSAKPMEKATELIIEDEVIGSGAEAVAGKKVTVNYVGTLTDGTKFDSSYDRNEPFSFTLGAGQVIEGWDKGFAGMKIGGKRKLTIPSSMGYGDNGIPGAIPGGATLVFEVELLNVE
jgi:FKBP-type peptidyl-prolyl cis-trans isomerase